MTIIIIIILIIIIIIYLDAIVALSNLRSESRQRWNVKIPDKLTLITDCTHVEDRNPYKNGGDRWRIVSSVQLYMYSERLAKQIETDTSTMTRYNTGCNRGCNKKVSRNMRKQRLRNFHVVAESKQFDVSAIEAQTKSRIGNIR